MGGHSQSLTPNNFDTEDGSSLFLRNAGNTANICTVLSTKHIICVTFILFWSFCDIFIISQLCSFTRAQHWDMDCRM